MAKKNQEIYQFKISLINSKPLIWRRIQVPANYSFWDLHVAIQDAMGWLDYHLHMFKIKNPKTNSFVEIGMPNEEFESYGRKALYDFKEKISNYFNEQNKSAVYEYDFGDSWQHQIKFEKILLALPGENYPKCLAGKMACPPEDCGGIGGFYNLLEIINDPSHEEYESSIEWLGDEYDSEYFDPAQVKFDDPKARWNTSFGR